MTGDSVSRAGFHDRLNLLHVVDVERGQTVIVLGGMIEQQTHGNEWHGVLLFGDQRIAAVNIRADFSDMRSMRVTSILPSRPSRGSDLRRCQTSVSRGFTSPDRRRYRWAALGPGG